MFFKKKSTKTTPAPTGTPGQDSAGSSGEKAANLDALPPEQELFKRVVALDCSLKGELRESLGALAWPQRVAGVQAEGADVTVSFLSDGMNLSQKVAVEEFITQEMRQRFASIGRLVVYMKRKDGPAPKQTGKGAPQRPADSESKAAASSPQGAGGASKGKTQLAGTQKPIPGVRRVLAVASGKGGVGKSTVSVNLAVSLHNQGYKVGLLDADIYGPSIPTMLNLSDDPQVNAQNKIVPPERHGVKVMSFGFFAGEEAAVIWRGPMIMKALQQFFYDVDWGELDFLVIDLPPGTGDAQLTLVQSLAVDGAVVVTTPQTVATLDAVKGVVMFQKTDVPVLGIVENMSTYHCPACGEESHIFGSGGAQAVSEKYGIPLLGSVPLNAAIREAGDSGAPLTEQDGHPVRVRFSEISEKVVAQVVAASREKAPKVSPMAAKAAQELGT